MASRPGRVDRHTLLGVCALGGVYYALSCPAAHTGAVTAIAWPAPAVAAAVLWRMQWQRTIPYLLAIFIAMLAVGDLDWLPWQSDLGFALLNTFEVALYTFTGRRFVTPTGMLGSTSELMRFVLLIPAAATAVVATLGATLATHVLLQARWWQEWRMLMVSNGVAMLVLVPALLACTRPWRIDETDRARPLGMLPATLAGAGGIAAVMLLSAALALPVEVERVLLSLVLVTLAIHGGVRSTVLSVGVMAVAGVSLSLLGFSPYHLDNADSIWRFQIDLSGLAILAFFVAIALHERRQLAARLEQARRLEALGLLAGGVAHDFRNILGAVRGYTEIAEEHLPSHSPALPALHEVVAASHRGRELTDQLLLATRRGERLRDTVDLTDAAQEAVMLARVLPRNGITITFTPPAHAFHVQAHHGQLVRALLNLIQNGMLSARRAVTIELASGMQAPSPLTMGETPKGKKLAWVSVQDDGRGIAAEHLPRIFEPFFSARDGKETDGKRRASNPAGSGLGLAIVAGIALEHDGGISVTTDDQGTRFCLVLPLIETVPARRSPSRHGTSPPHGTKDEPCP